MFIIINNEEKTIEEWSDSIGLTPRAFIARLKKTSDNEELIKPPNVVKQIFKHSDTINNIYTEIDQNTYNLKQISEKYKIPVNTIRRRYKRGLRGKDLIKPTKHN
jgi:hypothetical protein